MLISVLCAVGCAIGSQYAVKTLVDVLSTGNPSESALWGAVAVLLGLVAGDNLLWRLAGWVATYAFVGLGGDLRLDLFDHLSGHGTRYFADRFPGALAARITTAANAAWSIESALTWNTIPPAAAVVSSIAVLGVIDWQITAVLFVIILALGKMSPAALPRNSLLASSPISPMNSTCGWASSGSIRSAKYSRSTLSTFAAILIRMPALAAMRIAASGAFSGEMRPMNARYPPAPNPGTRARSGSP